MNIYIWGTSPLAGRIVGDVIPAGRVTGFIDNFYEKESFMDKPVLAGCSFTERIRCCCCSEYICG